MIILGWAEAHGTHRCPSRGSAASAMLSLPLPAAERTADSCRVRARAGRWQRAPSGEHTAIAAPPPRRPRPIHSRPPRRGAGPAAGPHRARRTDRACRQEAGPGESPFSLPPPAGLTPVPLSHTTTFLPSVSIPPPPPPPPPTDRVPDRRTVTAPRRGRAGPGPRGREAKAKGAGGGRALRRGAALRAAGHCVHVAARPARVPSVGGVGLPQGALRLRMYHYFLDALVMESARAGKTCGCREPGGERTRGSPGVSCNPHGSGARCSCFL